MISKKELNDQLNNISSWTTVSFKNKIISSLSSILKDNENVINLLECILVSEDKSGKYQNISGILIKTNQRFFFLNAEKNKSEFFIISSDEIMSINIEERFSLTKIVISTKKSEFIFNSISKEREVYNFFKELNSQNNNYKNNKQVKKDDEQKNYNFLFNEAKKIFKVLYDFLNTINDEIFRDLLINDLLVISSSCINKKDAIDEEKFFLILVLLPLINNINQKDKLVIIDLLKEDNFNNNSKEIINNNWDFIKDKLVSDKGDLSLISFISLEYLNKYDKKYGTASLDKIQIILSNFSQCLIKSDGSISKEEEIILRKINSLIYKIYKDEDDKNILIKEKKVDLDKDLLIKEKEDVAQEEVKLEDVMKELNKLIGMKKIKDQISTLVNLIKVQDARKEKGLPISKFSLHSVFYGPPGTGKTTIARLLSKIYKCLGLLKKGHLIETDRAGLVAGYVGQTAIKVDEVVNKALDGVLFIDEAYSLKPFISGNDFGQEAIESLLKRMEDYRERFVVIVAGYTDEMQFFINSNPGLKSRFNRYFYFDHYTPQELFAIFEIFCKNVEFNITKEAKEKLLKLIKFFYEKKDRTFGNGRFVRNVFEKVVEKQANRIASITPLTEKILCTISKEDIPDQSDFFT